MAKRIVLLMQFYDPEPIYKGQKFAEKLQNMGYDIEVVTGFPNYPGGKVYDGYKIRVLKREKINGINITRIPLYPSHDSSRIGRVLNYVSFMLSAFFYLLFGARKSDMIYVYHPPLTVGLAAAAAQLVRRTPIVLDIHDLWPDTLPATGMLTNPKLLKVIDAACNWLYRRATRIIVQSDGFKALLMKRGVPEDKLVTVIGWHDEDAIQKPAQAEPEGFPADDNSLRVLFAGNMGRAQALDSVIEAAAQLAEAGHERDVSFFFLGSGLALDDLKAQAAQANLSNVTFLGRVPPHEVGGYFAAADCLLVHLRDEPLFSITIPSKTQAYLLAGKPILMAVAGEASRLVETAKAGIAANPQDPSSIAQACLDLARMSAEQRELLGSAGRAFYLRELSMDTGMAKFNAVFQSVFRG